MRLYSYISQWKKTLNYSEVSAALVSYEVRRQDILSSSGNTTAEALAVRVPIRRKEMIREDRSPDQVSEI